MYHETYTLLNLSTVAINQGEGRIAISHAKRANELSQKIGERSGEAWSLLYLGYANLLEKNYAVAKDFFQESVTIRTELGQQSLAFEPAAGLIQVALQTNDLVAASGETEKILQHLEGGGSFEGTEEPLRIYLACYRALEKLRDPRSLDTLHEAVKLLETQVSKLPDAEACRMFIQNVPYRRDIQASWKNLQRGLN